MMRAGEKGTDWIGKRRSVAKVFTLGWMLTSLGYLSLILLAAFLDIKRLRFLYDGHAVNVVYLFVPLYAIEYGIALVLAKAAKNARGFEYKKTGSAENVAENLKAWGLSALVALCALLAALWLSPYFKI